MHYMDFESDGDFRIYCHKGKKTVEEWDGSDDVAIPERVIREFTYLGEMSDWWGRRFDLCGFRWIVLGIFANVTKTDVRHYVRCQSLTDEQSLRRKP